SSSRTANATIAQTAGSTSSIHDSRTPHARNPASRPLARVQVQRLRRSTHSSFEVLECCTNRTNLLTRVSDQLMILVLHWTISDRFESSNLRHFSLIPGRIRPSL